MSGIPKIVIVGGGTAGLALATRLGDTLGRKKLAEITLIDPNRTHLWKPLLHEIASGSLDTGHEALSYRAHSSEHHYYFRLGRLTSIDTDQKWIELEPLHDHHGKPILDTRTIPYDYLVLAIGSHSNDFGIEGVKANCYTLDNALDAEDFHLTMLNRFLQFSETPEQHDPISVTIIGAGATGVELAAELYTEADELERFGVKHIHHNSLKINLIEAADRILPALPEEVSEAATLTLSELGVEIHTQTLVKSVEANGVTATKLGQTQLFESDLIVWAAGVQAPKFLSGLGLTTNRINQVEVNEYLQAKGHEEIFVLGDCASFQSENAARPVPPTAQAAHQMGMSAAQTLVFQITQQGQKKPFEYHDHGVLVSLSHFQTLGSLLDNLFHKKWTISGKTAELAYASLYRKHQLALHGPWKTFWMLLSHLIEKRVKPKLKLY